MRHQAYPTNKGFVAHVPQKYVTNIVVSIKTPALLSNMHTQINTKPQKNLKQTRPTGLVTFQHQNTTTIEKTKCNLKIQKIHTTKNQPSNDTSNTHKDKNTKKSQDKNKQHYQKNLRCLADRTRRGARHTKANVSSPNLRREWLNWIPCGFENYITWKELISYRRRRSPW